MVMSLARAALRMQRLKREANKLGRLPDQVVGHELDWLALCIAQPEIVAALNIPAISMDTRGALWTFCGGPNAGSGLSQKLLPGPASAPDSPNIVAQVLAFRTRLAELTVLPRSHRNS
jgi:hypothetical protein